MSAATFSALPEGAYQFVAGSLGDLLGRRHLLAFQSDNVLNQRSIALIDDQRIPLLKILII